MADANFRLAPIARERSTILERLGLEPGDYVVATLHREANVAEPRLGRILEGSRPDRGAGRLPGAPADARRDRRARVRPDDRPLDRAARLPRLRRARVAGARDRHRLRRPAEGGLLVRRALRDRAAVDRVGRHGRGRRERARRRRPRPARRGGRDRAHAGRRARRSTATGTPPSASRPLCTLPGRNEPDATTSPSSAPATSACRTPRPSPRPARRSCSSTSSRDVVDGDQPRREPHRGRPLGELEAARRGRARSPRPPTSPRSPTPTRS